MVDPVGSLVLGHHALLGHFARDVVACALARTTHACVVVRAAERANDDERAPASAETRRKVRCENGDDD